jgi:hypothetical protein
MVAGEINFAPTALLEAIEDEVASSTGDDQNY